MQIYSDPDREDDPHALPDIEVFELTATECAEMDEDLITEYMRKHEFRFAGFNRRDRDKMLDSIVENEGITGGWFWQACFPGCLPDGPPTGPFAAWQEAKADAQSST